jgi:hypothetical protein
MDYWLIWLQTKIGPVTFGAISGFVLQVILFRPTNWSLAAERAVAAMVMSVLFYQPVADAMVEYLGMDRDYAISVASATLAIGGIELLKKARDRLLGTVGGGK